MKQMFLAALVTATCAHAEPIALVTGHDYAPFTHSLLPEGGMATEIVRKAFAAASHEIKLDWLPWARGYEQTKAGKFAGTFPYVRSTEREQDFLYSSPIYEVRDHAFIRAGSKLDFANPPSLAGKTICMPTGWAPPSSLVDMIKSGQLKREEPRDISYCARMVLRGRADFFVSDPIQGGATVASAGISPGEMHMSDVTLSRAPLHLIAPKSSPASAELIAAFNRGLASLRKSGEYDKIVEKHSKLKPL